MVKVEALAKRPWLRIIMLLNNVIVLILALLRVIKYNVTVYNFCNLECNLFFHIFFGRWAFGHAEVR